MAVISIGGIIRETRKRNSISQEVLCEGICEPSTLSKIENGHQNPSKKVLEALCQRLGMQIGLINIPVDESDFRKHELEKSINSKIADKDFDIQNLLQEYKSLCPIWQPLEEQFFLLYTGMHLSGKKISPPESNIELFKAALKKTMRSFETLSSLEGHLLTTQEILCVHNISLEYEALKQYNQASAYELFLKNYFENHQVDYDEKAKFYPLFLDCLTRWAALTGDYEKCIELGTMGVKACFKYNKIIMLPTLLYYKGDAQCNLGQMNDGKQSIQHAIGILMEAGDVEFCDTIRKDFENCFNQSLD